MADVSDPAIAEAYNDVRSDKSPLNLLLCRYENEKSNKLVLAHKGEGGLGELTGLLQEDEAAFAYVRVEYANDKESSRVRFVLISWIGPSVKIMRKARVSVHASDVKAVLRAYSIDVAASSRDDLDEKTLVTRLRKAGGASYDGV